MRLLKDMFALSEKGAKDLKKATWASAFADFSIIIPVGLLLFVVMELINPLLGEPTNELNVFIFTAIAGILTILIFVAHYVQYNVSYVAAYEESANRRITLAESLRKLPLSFFGRKDAADITVTTMTDSNVLESIFSHYIPQLLGSIIIVVLGSISLILFDWRMALSMFAALPLSLLVVFGSRRIQDRYSKYQIEARVAAADGIQEFLEGIEEIKAYDTEKEVYGGLRSKFKKLEKRSMVAELISGISVMTGQIILNLGMVIMILVGTILLSGGEIDVLKFILFVFVATRLFGPLEAALISIAVVFNSKVRIERMNYINNYPKQGGSTDCVIDDFNIEFDDVTFSYDDSVVIKGITFTAKQGEVTALVGPSGSGKSTISKLAARFWDVDSGRITIGGVDVNDIEPETLLKNFSIVFQDVVLFNDTVMNNIRIGKEGATDEEVIAAAEAAQCVEFIEKLPNGYETEIGENGSTLSGGERQRISIARALLKDAPIILLDEATAALDVENETKIQTAISRLIKDKTVMIIAHRMRTVAGADKIVVLKNGSIEEQGTHDQLIGNNGLYRRMVDLQTASSRWSPVS